MSSLNNKIIEKIRRIPYIDKLIERRNRREIDAFIVSFPKCGRTWLRLMIGKAIAQHFELSISEHDLKLIFIRELSKLNGNIPQIICEHDDDAFFKAPEELNRSKLEYGNNKVLFLIRDPRDVIVSSYFHKKYRANFFPKDPSKQPYVSYDGEIDQFIRERVGSLRTLIEYYNIWDKNKHIPSDYMLLRYEDLVADPVGSLRKTLNFLELAEISDDIVAEVVEYASFNNMRKMETNNLFNSGILKPTNPSEPYTYKTRQGKVGGFREHLDENSILYANEQIRNYLSPSYKLYYDRQEINI